MNKLNTKMRRDTWATAASGVSAVKYRRPSTYSYPHLPLGAQHSYLNKSFGHLKALIKIELNSFWWDSRGRLFKLSFRGPFIFGFEWIKFHSMARDELDISGFGSEEIGSRDRPQRRENASRGVDSTRPAHDVFVSFAVQRLLRSDPTQKTLHRASTELSNGVTSFWINWWIDRVIRNWRRPIARIQRHDRLSRPLLSWICGQTPAPIRTDPKDVW